MRLSEYSQEDQDILTGDRGKPRLHSDTLPRVDGDLSHWTTEIKLSEGVTTQPVFASDMDALGIKNRDHTRGGVRVLPHKGSE